MCSLCCVSSRFGIRFFAFVRVVFLFADDVAVVARLEDSGGFNWGSFYVMFLNPDYTVKNWRKLTFSSVVGISDGFAKSVTSIGDIDGMKCAPTPRALPLPILF
jgi:hypothetical protein